MTMDDAVDRACALWGDGRIVQVVLRADGSADVGVHPPTSAVAVGLMFDGNGVTEHHQLDRHGRPTCHDDCRVVDDARRQA
jgi:hypothetical protein